MKRSIFLGISAAMCLGFVGAGLALRAQSNVAIEADAVISVATTYKIDINAVDGWKNETSDFYLHAWDKDDNNLTGEWPGQAINSSAFNDGVITITAPANTNGFLINRNGGVQTVNIYACDLPGSTFTLSGGKDASNNLEGAWPTVSDGWYVVGSSTGWKLDPNYKQTSTPDGYRAKWTGVSFATGDTMKLAFANGVWIDNDYWQDWNRITDASSRSALIDGGFARNEDSSEKPNIYFEFGGTYDIALNNAYEITLTPTDETVVNKFVADYFTVQMAESYAGKTDEQRATDCKTKYDAAHDAYDDLTPSQKSLFGSGAAYAAAREAYAIWEASAKKDDPAEAFRASSSADNSTTIIVITVASLAVVGMASFFFLRKKKEQ